MYLLVKGEGYEEYQDKLVAVGACEAVAKALVKFSEVESVAHACCRALVVLLLKNQVYKAKLGNMGVCSCLVESLHLFPSSVQVMLLFSCCPPFTFCVSVDCQVGMSSSGRVGRVQRI